MPKVTKHKSSRQRYTPYNLVCCCREAVCLHLISTFFGSRCIVSCCSAGTERHQTTELSCCSNQSLHAYVQQEGPDISRLDPALQLQWDHAANAHLGHLVIKPYSAKKVGWICDQCPDGHLHSWSASVQNRTNGTGCPQCSGHKVCKHNCLTVKAPSVAAQWDCAANDGSPDGVVAQSNTPVGWLCDVCGHRWRQAPAVRVSKNRAGCPQCALKTQSEKKRTYPTFAECNHPLLAEWDYERNAAEGHFPDKVSLRSGRHIFWICTKCPAGQEHSWASTPAQRTGRTKTGCPVCSGQVACKCNSLQALHPDTAAEWDYAKNQGQPSDYSAGSNYAAWWSSPQRGSWQQPIDSRTFIASRRSAYAKRVQQSFGRASVS